MEITLFHGSGETVMTPKILMSKYTKDFGCGFYCTRNYSQAERWALKHNVPRKGLVPTVNLYAYTPQKGLSIKVFPEMTDEWLDFIVACRHGDPHTYDIVEGAMADDDIWNYVEDFIAGRMSREAFWALAKFKHPTHQIAFATDKALQCLVFEKAVLV